MKPVLVPPPNGRLAFVTTARGVDRAQRWLANALPLPADIIAIALPQRKP